MANLQFQAKVKLNRATQLDGHDWEVEVVLSDGEGLVRGNDIQVGDVLVFDTGVIESGTYTRYDITEVKGVSWTGEINLVIQYRDDNTNATENPELTYVEGAEGVITRPSPILGLLPVVSPSVQGVVDAFSFYMLNHNLVKIIDHPRSDSSGSGTLITAQWLPVYPDGKAPLPSPPVGDLVLNMGLAFLADGSMVEVLGVTTEFDEETSTWYAVIPESDMAELGGMVGALTVSYLTNL